MACWGQQLKAPSRGDNHLPSLRGMEAWLTGWRGLVPWPRLPHLHLHPGDHRWKGVVTEIWPEGPQCSTDHVSCSGSGQDAGNRSPPVLRNLRNLPRGPRPQASLRSFIQQTLELSCPSPGSSQPPPRAPPWSPAVTTACTTILLGPRVERTARSGREAPRSWAFPGREGAP